MVGVYFWISCARHHMIAIGLRDIERICNRPSCLRYGGVQKQTSMSEQKLAVAAELSAGRQGFSLSAALF